MFAHRTGQGPRPGPATLKAGTRLRRLAGGVAAAAVGLLASVATIPAAFARDIPPSGGSYGTTSVVPVSSTTVHAAAAGGLAGWQIALIAVAAALVVAAVTFLLERADATRRAVPSPAV